jgi:2-oxoglutarate dehydrogenase E1 component
MSEPSQPKLGINSWLEEELYQQYRHDRKNVDESWKTLFDTASNGRDTVLGAMPNGAASNASGAAGATVAEPPKTAPAAAANGAAPPATALAIIPPYVPVPGDQLQPLRGAAARIAENMTASLTIPTATSQRQIAVKLLDENRRLVNEARAQQGLAKLSYTHIVAWAIVKALGAFPVLNNAYAEQDGEGFRVVRESINLGVAVDVAGKDGTRSLKVPNIKNAQTLNFAQFCAAYDDLVARTRAGKLLLPDFEGTTISLTNPGTVGTVGSIPRLMPGQGAIIATGAIDYPPEYRGVSEEVRSLLGLSKVMMVTCTYDHRVIQGAESGMFLAKLQALLEGEEGFYEQIFEDLKIGLAPAKWQPDTATPSLAPQGMDVAKAVAVERLIDAYRTRGHLAADLNPLASRTSIPRDLDPSYYGLSLFDLDRPVTLDGQKLTLRELVERLRETYSGKMGVEFMHIQNPEEREWFLSRMEPTRNQWDLGVDTRRRILQRIVEAEGFEVFLHTRFVGHKRFSLEGGESVVAILDETLDQAANHGVAEAVIGMAHRGRLTVLANIVGKSMVQLFSEFDGDIDPDSIEGSGDVKYHLGAKGTVRSTKGNEIAVSVAFNPSHLEAVDPVVQGIVRPKQNRLGDTKRERVLPILIHGDAAFAGQGVVMETFNISQVKGYHVGGTVHIVINNQIGFTANPDEARSGPYCSDVALSVQAPVFHVNGDDPEACVRAAQLALEYRQKFHKDVVIDMICYRKHGHNEADDPSYTQPILYKQIRAQKPVTVQYAERLQKSGLVTAGEVETMRKGITARLNEIYDLAQKQKEQFELQELSAIPDDEIGPHLADTTVPKQTLEYIVDRITTFPQTFHLHPKLKPFLDKRREALHGGPVDWALAESLAFGSLVLEGTPVRLSGQDSGRGTFSQRHAVYADYETGFEYFPLQHLSPNQATFEVIDSALSEYAVMGFEFGYSVADPLTLVLWEAQFGDFANGAQIIIDQFIAAAESKWGQPSGLVLLLPHGQEGQGPEHSSCRIERFLQLCGENNIQVANCTTPAQYFHLLRRQMHGGPDRRGVRKPLIIATPKSILRHPKAVSTLEELASGRFLEVLDDATITNPDVVNRVLLCSGKVYYDLIAAREENKITDVAIVRLEQLYPFATSLVKGAIHRYPIEAEVVWVQEEPRNAGPWRFVWERIQPVLEGGRRLRYVGRPESASPSPGSLKRHQYEQAKLVEEAFAPLPVSKRPRTRLVRRRKNLVR